MNTVHERVGEWTDELERVMFPYAYPLLPLHPPSLETSLRTWGRPKQKLVAICLQSLISG